MGGEAPSEGGTHMIIRLMGTLFAPKYPRFYTGRHRAPMRLRTPAIRLRSQQTAELA